MTPNEGQSKFEITLATFLYLLTTQPSIIMSEEDQAIEVYEGPHYRGTLLGEEFAKFKRWQAET